MSFDSYISAFSRVSHILYYFYLPPASFHTPDAAYAAGITRVMRALLPYLITASVLPAADSAAYAANVVIAT